MLFKNPHLEKNTKKILLQTRKTIPLGSHYTGFRGKKSKASRHFHLVEQLWKQLSILFHLTPPEVLGLACHHRPDLTEGWVLPLRAEATWGAAPAQLGRHQWAPPWAAVPVRWALRWSLELHDSGESGQLFFCLKESVMWQRMTAPREKTPLH